MTDDTTQNRRQFIVASGTAIAAAGLAGCSSGSGEEGNGNGNGDGGASISFGETYEGEIQEDSQNLPEYDEPGTLTEEKIGVPIEFSGSSGQNVNITMRADSDSDLDAYLVLEDPDGQYVEANDDGTDMEGYNSRLTTELSADGTYTIWATTFGGEATGPFTVSLSED